MSGWDPTNNWKIVVAPDSLANSSGDLQFARNGVRRATVRANGEVAAAGGFATINPSNTSASVSLNFLNNIARIRTGGTGAGADNGFQIHGTGDVIRWSVDGAGNVDNSGNLRMWNGKEIQFMNSSGMTFDGSGNIKPRDPLTHATGAYWWVNDMNNNYPLKVWTGTSGGYVEAKSRPYTTVTGFLNGWTEYGIGFGGVSYTKDAAGVVMLKGLMRSGVVGQPGFNLPAGFRPGGTLLFNGVDGVNQHTRIDVSPNGDVKMTAGNNAFCSLNGIRFLAEN